MAIPAEYLRAAKRFGPELDEIAAMYRNPVTGRALSGTALMLKTFKGESGFRKDAVSNKGARGPGQFMPQTRQAVLEKSGGKIDPWRSADEAAQAMVMHMTGQLGHAKGLSGYNPGDPNYPSYILGQKVGDVGGTRSGSGAGSGGTTMTTTTPGGTQTVQLPGAPQLDLQGLLSRITPAPKPQAMGVPAPKFAAGQQFQSIPASPAPEREGPALDLAGILASAQPAPSTREYQLPGQTTTTTGGSGPGAKGSAKGKSPLFEMFYNGPGGVNVDNGRRVGKGFVSGHTDHVHVAAGPKTVDRLGRLAQKMGLRVSENETFDRVDPVHTQGSYHYKNRAIDVSGDPKAMRRFNREVAAMYGLSG